MNQKQQKKLTLEALAWVRRHVLNPELVVLDSEHVWEFRDGREDTERSLLTEGLPERADLNGWCWQANKRFRLPGDPFDYGVVSYVEQGCKTMLGVQGTMVPGGSDVLTEALAAGREVVTGALLLAENLIKVSA